MKNLTAFICILIMGCSKTNIAPVPVTKEKFVAYTILAGKHYSDRSSIKAIQLSEQVFTVKFNNSAIYESVDPENQSDINKLYGFSEGQDPHMNSARIGWSYNGDKLRLYAYTYLNGDRNSKEICPISIDETVSCSIKLQDSNYVFSVNNIVVKLPRATDNRIATGYQLYPYFGGDEPAPHNIQILLYDLSHK